MDNDMLDIRIKVRLELYQTYKPCYECLLRMDAQLLYKLDWYSQAEQWFLLTAMDANSCLFGEKHKETMACVMT